MLVVRRVHRSDQAVLPDTPADWKLAISRSTKQADARSGLGSAAPEPFNSANTCAVFLASP